MVMHVDMHTCVTCMCTIYYVQIEHLEEKQERGEQLDPEQVICRGVLVSIGICSPIHGGCESHLKGDRSGSDFMLFLIHTVDQDLSQGRCHCSAGAAQVS